MNTVIRPIRFAFFVLLGAAGVTGALAIFAACAHAKVTTDGVSYTQVAQAAAVVDSTAVAAWVGAITGGLALVTTVLGVLYLVLRVVAPLTPTKIDDELRDGIGEILDHVRGQAQAPSTTTTTVNVSQPAPATEPTVHTRETSPGTLPTMREGGFVGMWPLVIMAGVAIGVASQAMWLGGCATAKPRAAAAVTAFLDCESPHVDAAMLADAKLLAKSAAEKWIGNDGRIDTAGLKADATPLRTDLLRCAMDAAIAALTAPGPAPKPEAPMAAPLTVDAVQVSAAWSQIRSELGWKPARGGG